MIKIRLKVRASTPAIARKMEARGLVSWVRHPGLEVRARVAASIRAIAQDGGYLFAGAHNIQHDASGGHLRATLDALRACGYP